MLFSEEDAPLLKAWIVKRIEDTSDADSDVLAEYVIALLKHDGDKAAVRKLCEEEIPDFLSEDPKAFLDDVFQAIAYRSFVPGAPPAPKLGAETHALPSIPPQPMTAAAAAAASFDPGALNASRKRGFREQDEMDTTGDGPDATQQQQQQQPGRAYKQPRRGGRGGRGGDDGLADGFVPRHNFPAFDANNPMEGLLQLQAMYPQNAHMMPWPQPRGGGGGGGRRASRRKARCRDFDTKGFCVRGTSCPYDHGSESLFGPPGEGDFLPRMLPGRDGGFTVGGGDMEYDPNTAMLGMPHPSQMNPFGFPPLDMGHSGRGRKNRAKRGGPPRASFSAEGAIYDRTKSTIVVESIPEDKFSEEEVRGFFSQFGSIEEVSMQPYKRLAIVKYSKWGSANAAYSSPKVIFDNRFVKVFWYKDDAGAVPPSVHNGPEWSGDPGASVEEEAEADVVDMEDFARRQEEAQKKQDEREAKRAEIDQKRLELEQKQRDLLARHREENEKLQAKLLLGGAGGDAPSSGPDMLRAKLAALEQEAKLLGLDPDAEDDAQSAYSQPRGGGGYRGRGGPRGRGGFAPRGRGRGGGGGSSGNMHAAYAQYSLDNRPKKLAVTGVDFTAPDKDESLRHFLLNLGEFESVEPSPTVTHVSFQDRKTATKFYHLLNGNQLPGVEGRLELAWVSSSTATSSTPTAPSVKKATTTTTTTTTKGPSADNGAKSTSAAAVGDDDKEDAMTGLQADDDDDDEAEEGEVVSPRREERAVNMDYEVADEDGW